MKTLVLSILLIPFLSFGQEVVQDNDQLSRKDKKSINEHAISMCGCVEDKVNSLHPRVAEVVLLLAEKGEEGATDEIKAMVEKMEEEELEAFLGAFAAMESDDFIKQLEVCNHTTRMSQEIQDQINNESGPAYDYFMEILSEEEACEFMKYVYEQGMK